MLWLKVAFYIWSQSICFREVPLYFVCVLNEFSTINPLRTVAAYVRHGKNNITICKQIAVTPLLKLQPFCLLCSGDYFNILGRVLKPT